MGAVKLRDPRAIKPLVDKLGVGYEGQRDSLLMDALVGFGVSLWNLL